MYCDDDRVDRICRSFCKGAYDKYEKTGIQTPIPFYRDVRTSAKRWRWYDTEKAVTYLSLVDKRNSFNCTNQ